MTGFYQDYQERLEFVIAAVEKGLATSMKIHSPANRSKLIEVAFDILMTMEIGAASGRTKTTDEIPHIRETFQRSIKTILETLG